MAEEDGMATMKIEDIRTVERFMFWSERAAIIVQLLLFPGSRYLLSSTTALLLLFSNVAFIALSVERQVIGVLFTEPDAIFYVERPAILLVILHYISPDGYAYGAFIGLIVLVLTNCALVYRFVEFKEQLPSKEGVSSETNTTQNAKETGMGDRDQEKKNEKAIINEKDKMSPEVVELLEAFMEGSFAPSITKNHKWLLDYLPFWKSLTGEEKKVLWNSFWESLDEEEKVLLMNSSPRFKSNSSTAMETIKDEGLKEKYEVEAKTRNSVDAISEPDSVHIKEEVGGHGEEHKTEEDESPELQGNNRNFSAGEDSNTEKDVQEQWTPVSLTDDENEDDLKEEEDETEGASDLDSDNQSWEKVQNDLSENLSEAIESSLDQQKTDEVEEAKDEQAAIGNYKSDDDDSWEEVQNIGAENNPSDKKKADPMEEVEHKEDSSNYNSDESSWEEGQNNLSRKSCASMSSEFFQEQMHEYEGNSQEKKGLKELLKQIEEEELRVEDEFKSNLGRESWNLNVKPDESSWEEGQNNLSRKSCASMSSEFSQEQMHENEGNSQEKNDLTELWKQIEEEELRVEDELKSNMGRESWNLNVKPDDAMETLEFAEERLKWSKEKQHLQAKLDAVTESSEGERLKWEEEKKELYAMLDAALQSCETSIANQTAFAEERQKWNEEKNALNAIISHTNENIQYCQTVVNTYNEHCLRLAKELNENHSLNQDSFNKLIAERDGLHSRLHAATSSAECYKAWYIQSAEQSQYYKTCLEEFQGKYSKLMEDHLSLSSKIQTESSFAEHYERLAQEFEDKCSRLEEEKTDLTAKLCAAKAASELYRSCLHDFVV